jgi:hypothetical protein
VAGFLGSHADKLTDDGRHRLVRHGHLPEREIKTGIGPVAMRAPRVRDRVGTGEERIAFSSAILPRYARRSKSLEVLIPILYLKGVSTGDFEEALAALLGKDAGGLSASTIARLKNAWADEHARWQKRGRPEVRRGRESPARGGPHQGFRLVEMACPRSGVVSYRSGAVARPTSRLTSPRRDRAQVSIWGTRRWFARPRRGMVNSSRNAQER